jgi:hypothetical protein
MNDNLQSIRNDEEKQTIYNVLILLPKELCSRTICNIERKNYKVINMFHAWGVIIIYKLGNKFSKLL